MKRVKVVPKKCPNPLFEKWLLEWRDEAKARANNLENHFAKAIISLRKYPLPLETGRDCILLRYFGIKLCTMLDMKLTSYLQEMRDARDSDAERIDTCDDVEHDSFRKKARSLEENSLSTEQTSKKQFVPKRKRRIGEKESERRENVISDSLAVPANELRQTSQESKKPFLRRSGEHSISSSGSSSGNDLSIVQIFANDDNEILNKPSNNGCNAAQEKPMVTKKLKNKRPDEDNNSGDIEVIKVVNTAGKSVKDQFEMPPNSFDVLLLVDTHETSGGNKLTKNETTISELDSSKTRYEIRHLKVGDFIWIARCRDTKRELVLPYVVERKRMDDLASSIKDGRFHEQKFRLKQSGIPNIIYMVESFGKNHYVGLPLPTLLQASTNSLVQDGFSIKFTDNHRHSMQYLSNLTSLIYKMYKGDHLVSSTKGHLDCVSTEAASKNKVPLMEFQQFNRAASKIKTFKVKEMFVKQLLQLKGLSVEKALAIVERYPTPEILAKALRSAGKGGEKLLASIQSGTLQRQLGPALSKIIFELYTKRTLE